MFTERWLASQLRAHGLATEEQLKAAAAPNAGVFCRNLLRAGALRETDLLKFLGHHFQTRYVSTRSIHQARIPRWMLDLLPADLCEQLKVLPIRCDRNLVLSVVTPDPSDTRVREVVKQASKVKVVRAYVALPDAVSAGIRKWYRGDEHAFDGLVKPRVEGPAGRDPRGARSTSSVSPLPGAGRLSDPGRSASSVGPLPAVPPTAERPPPGRDQGAPLAPRPAPEAVPLPDAAPGGLSFSGLAVDDTIAALVTVAEREDGWRQGHATEVAAIAGRMAQAADLPTAAQQHLRLAALLHELGKPTASHLTVLAIDEDPALAALAARVYRVPVDILHGAGLPRPVANILLAQYERADGRGVPRGLAGDDIPVETRILQVADAACHLLSNPLAPRERAARDAACVEALRTAAERGSLDRRQVELLATIIDASGDEARRPWDRPRLLIVDREVEAALPLAMALVARGFYAGTAGTTAEAAREVLSSEVDLIISEVDLTPVDGIDFFEQLRSDPRTRRIPVVFLTYRSDPGQIQRARQLGALDYVVKPYDVGHLVDTICRVFEGGGGGGPRAPAVSGSLEVIALGNIVQTLSSAGRTGKLRLGSGNGHGEIYLSEGQIVHGRYKDLTGEEAVIEMLTMSHEQIRGEFTFDPTPTAPARTVERSTDALLSEARARRGDPR